MKHAVHGPARELPLLTTRFWGRTKFVFLEDDGCNLVSFEGECWLWCVKVAARGGSRSAAAGVLHNARGSLRRRTRAIAGYGRQHSGCCSHAARTYTCMDGEMMRDDPQMPGGRRGARAGPKGHAPAGGGDRRHDLAPQQARTCPGRPTHWHRLAATRTQGGGVHVLSNLEPIMMHANRANRACTHHMLMRASLCRCRPSAARHRQAPT